MTTRLQQARGRMRRDLHREMSVPALYIVGNSAPIPVTVRRHNKFAKTGGIPGLETVELQDVATHLRFWRDELVTVGTPKRNAIVSVAAGEAYRLGDALPTDRETQDVNVTRLDDAEAAGLPLPEGA